MTSNVYKTVEITGSSKDSIEKAVEAAVSRAGDTLHGLRWFEVTDIRGHLVDGNIEHWQVTTKIGFTLDEDS